MNETMSRRGETATPHPTTKRAAAIAAVAALGALALEAMLVTPNAANPIPTSGPVPISGLPAVIAAVFPGAAIAFTAFGREPTRWHVATHPLAAVLYVPGTWVLTSRWVYENLHTIESLDLGRLLRIESAFDVALIVAAAAMAWALVTKPRDNRRP